MQRSRNVSPMEKVKPGVRHRRRPSCTVYEILPVVHETFIRRTRVTADYLQVAHFGCNVFGRPYYRSRLCHSMSSVCLSVVCRLSSVTFCILAKRLDRFA